MSVNNLPSALLLEDEPLIALDLEATLQEAGFEVSSLGSAKEAAGYLEIHTPSVVILDIRLTDGSCSHIAEMLVARNIPFIVHTGEPETDHRDTIFGKGTWLSKPSHGGDLSTLAQSLASTR